MHWKGRMTQALNPGLAYGDRVDRYVKFRPTYPDEAVSHMLRHRQGAASIDIADIGAGTGILSAQLLRYGHRVFAVEPEEQMRQAAQATLSGCPGFQSVDGSAEATTLPNRSVDLVVAAQALHWFEPTAARREFARILRPGGRAAAIWNERRRIGSAFRTAYEHFLSEMQQDIVGDRKCYAETVGDVAGRFFEVGSYTEAAFSHNDRLDRRQFAGRILSGSFAPGAAHERYGHWCAAIDDFFEVHAERGYVTIEYESVVVIGTVQ
jgi:Methylase involved in ubiquinone/menaquinone biosynthesis